MEDIKIDCNIFTLGTKIVKFNLPIEFIDSINKAYDENLKNLKPFNDELAGKIVEENEITSILTDDTKMLFARCFEQYLKSINKPIFNFGTLFILKSNFYIF